MKQMRLFSFFLSVLFSVTIYASSGEGAYVSWLAKDEVNVLRLDIATGKLDVFLGSAVQFAGRFSTNFDSTDIFSNEHGRVHQIENGYLASFSGSGQVFKISFKDSSISRLDGTHQHGYNFNAFQFLREEELYSFGGYGFWMENNVLTKFDPEAKEWFLSSVAPFPVEVNKENSMRNMRWFDEVEDVFYVVHEKTLYAYSFKEDQWKAMGRLHREMFESTEMHFNKLTDSTGFAFSDRGYWLMDWRNNSIRELNITSAEAISPRSGISGVRCMYAQGADMVVFRRTDKVEAGFLRSVYTPAAWANGSPMRLYTPYVWFKLGFYGLVSLIVTVLIVFFRVRYLRLVKRRSSWEEFLTPSDRLLYMALQKGDLDTEEVNNLLGLGEYGWEVQRRKRSEAIKSINAFASKALGFDIIERHKSPQDKRQIIYKLNPALKK